MTPFFLLNLEQPAREKPQLLIHLLQFLRRLLALGRIHPEANDLDDAARRIAQWTGGMINDNDASVLRAANLKILAHGFPLRGAAQSSRIRSCVWTDWNDHQNCFKETFPDDILAVPARQTFTPGTIGFQHATICREKTGKGEHAIEHLAQVRFAFAQRLFRRLSLGDFSSGASLVAASLWSASLDLLFQLEIESLYFALRPL